MTLEPHSKPTPTQSTYSDTRRYLQEKPKIGVETMRQQGIDFESRVAVCQGAPSKNLLKLMLPVVFDHRDFMTFSEVGE